MAKSSKLQQWLNRNKDQVRPKHQIMARPPGQPIPLTPCQLGVWALQSLQPNNPFYHYVEQYTIRGPLQVDQLQQALDLLVQRHRILDTTFTLRAGQPVQETGPARTVEFTFLSALTDSGVAAKNLVDRYLAFGRLPFDLSEGPLFRALLVQRTEVEFDLLLSLHHLVIDKWSMQLLREDLVIAYQALVQHQTPNFSPQAIQFLDYAYWLAQQPHEEKHLIYWKEKLRGSLPILNLPLDHPRPEVPSYSGRYNQQVLSKELSAQLRELCVTQEVTLFIFMLSIWKVVLHRYTQQKDIIVGTPVTSRDKQALQKMVGFFDDTIVFRSKIDPEKSFLTLVKEVKETVFNGLEHKQTPFSLLVKTLQPERHANINPIFQSMFMVNTTTGTTELAPGLSMEYQPFDLGSTKFDLTLFVNDVSEHIGLYIEYATDLFEVATIERLQSHLKTLLTAIVTAPETPIAALELLPAAEYERLAAFQFGAPLKPVSTTHYLELFAQQVQQQPQQIALSYQEQTLTYAQLDTRSTTLAKHIVQSGQLDKVQPFVGLYVERSLDMIVGMLAIHKAGGAYVPLPADYPKERLSYILADAKVKLVITQNHLAQQLGSDLHFSQRILALESLPTTIPAVDLPRIQPADMAYMIYTSGSTGRPKGVAISHANLHYSTLARLQYYSASPSSFLLLSSFAFDSSVAGIYWTLVSGGKLVLTPSRIEQDLAALGQLIAQEEVTHTLLLPSLYEAILAYIDVAKLQTLQHVIVAGEACGRQVVQTHFERLPTARLYNEYGPTEATVWSTVHEILASEQEQQVPIGRPIPGSQVLLLDQALRTCPLGQVGEVYIASPGLAGGYHERPELDAEKFVHYTSPRGEKLRLYRSGDLGRFAPDGAIIFLGRSDEQVKFRGYRIELTEIRAVINNASPNISDSYVMITEAPRRLVAYLVSDQAPSREHLVPLLRDQLPNYMIPTHVVNVQKLPRLPNGKVDRNSLPPVVTTGKASVNSAVNDDVTTKLTKIWEDVLGVEGIQPDANFFAIGGDSILSIQIIARARNQGILLAPNAIFENPSIQGLTNALAIEHSLTTESKAVEGNATTSSDFVRELQDIWSTVLGLGEVQPSDNFFEIGGDSILSIQIIARARKRGIELPPNAIFEHQTIEALALHTSEYTQGHKPVLPAISEAPLLPIQHWFFEQHRNAPHYWNQGMCWELPAEVGHLEIESRLQSLVKQQTTLRLAFDYNNNRQWVTEVPTQLLEVVDIALDGTTVEEEAISNILQAAQDSITLSSGRAWRAIYLRRKAGPDRFYLLAHHLVVDIVSWTIITDYLANLANTSSSPVEQTTYLHWSQQLSRWATEGKFEEELTYWRAQKGKESFLVESAALPIQEQHVETTTFTVDLAASQGFSVDVHEAYGTKTEDLLLLALGRVVHRVMGKQEITIGIEHYGREHILDNHLSLATSVGWFTTSYPLLLLCDEGEALEPAIKRTKEQLRGVPNKGIGYGVLRYLTGQQDLLYEPSIVFNYLGQQTNQQVHRLGTGTFLMTDVRHPRSERYFPWEINLQLRGTVLDIRWSYSPQLHSHTLIDQLLTQFGEELLHLINHCLHQTERAYTSSDFTAVDLDSDDLSHLLSQLED